MPSSSALGAFCPFSQRVEVRTPTHRERVTPSCTLPMGAEAGTPAIWGTYSPPAGLECPVGAMRIHNSTGTRSPHRQPALHVRLWERAPHCSAWPCRVLKSELSPAGTGAAQTSSQGSIHCPLGEKGNIGAVPATALACSQRHLHPFMVWEGANGCVSRPRGTLLERNPERSNLSTWQQDSTVKESTA